MKRINWLAFICMLVIIELSSTSPAADVSLKPNVLFILCDDLGIGDVHSFNVTRGKIATPNIDALAGEGMKFTDAHGSSALCTPSRYSILTGRYNWRTRLQSGVLGGHAEPLIEADRMTVAQFLKQQGYTTECIGKWHLGLTFGPQRFVSPIVDGPLQHGFDHFYGIAASLDMAPFAWIDDNRFPEAPTVKKTFDRQVLASRDFEPIDVLPTLTRRSVEYIQTHGRSNQAPYFLYLALTSPHVPLVPTPQWKGKSGLGDYGDFVMETDACIGEVLKAVDEAGGRNNTLVYLTSDNGCAPYIGVKDLEAKGHYPSADYRGYKSDIWEGGHRIPLIVRWPGVIKPSSLSSQYVGLFDFFATVADILQQKLRDDAAVDSFSLLPIFKGNDVPVHTYIINHSGDGYFAVREGNWKLELCSGSGGWSAPREAKARDQGLPMVQLYDLKDDVGEKHNVEADHPDIVSRLSGILERAIKDGRTTPGPAQRNDAPIEINKNPSGAKGTRSPANSVELGGDGNGGHE